MARPKKEINWDLVVKKMEAGCTAAEIYNSNDDTHCHAQTFYQRFKDEFGHDFSNYSKSCSELGKGQIRLMLYLKALDNRAPGNATLLMFLARCELGMKEPETTTLLAANQSQLDQSHLIMLLKNEVRELKRKMNFNEYEQISDIKNEPETGSEFCGSDPSI